MDRLREIIDELAKNPDFQAGDIDTDHPQRPPRQHREQTPPIKNPESSDDEEIKREGPGKPKVRTQKETLQSLIDNFYGLYMILNKFLRTSPQLIVPPEDVLMGPYKPKDPT